MVTKPAIKPRPKDGQPIVTRLAYAAGEEGMYASDLIRFPELLAKYKLLVADCHAAVASNADQLNREENSKVLAYWKGRTIIPPIRGNYAGTRHAVTALCPFTPTPA